MEPISRNGIEIIMDKVDVNGTSLVGYINMPYDDLVATLGKPNGHGDDFKTDVEWEGTINGKGFTIYNYKDGPNYMGKDGLAVRDITEWHVGGNSRIVAHLMTAFMAQE